MAFKQKRTAERNHAMYVFLGIAALLFFLVASSVLPFLSGSDLGASSDLLLCFVCCIPAFVPQKSAAVFALVTGLFADLFVNNPLSFSPIVYLVGVVAVGYFYGFFSRIGTLVMAVCSLPCLLLRTVVDTFAVMSMYEGSTAFGVLSKITLPSLVLNFALAIVSAFLLRIAAKKLRIYY